MKSILVLLTLLAVTSSQASYTCNYLPSSDDEDTTNFQTYVIDLQSERALLVEDISSQENFALARELDYKPTKANKGYIKFLAPNTSEFLERAENAFEYMIVSPQIQKNRKSGLIKLALEVGGGHGLYYDRYSCTRD